MLVSDPSDTTHDDTCGAIIEGVDENLTVGYHYGSFQAGVQYALDNGYAVVSRSTTGLADYDNTAEQEILDSGGIAVHAHGSNTYEEINDYSSVQSIVSVRDADGSYGDGIEFTLTNYTTESWTTAYMAGKIASYGRQYPALTYTQIRQVIRDNSSNGGTWAEITGYGTPDWSAVETALAGL